MTPRRTRLDRFFRRLGVLIYRWRLAPLVFSITRRVPRVVLYHACEATESDAIAGLDINTTPATFALHLDYYRRHYTIVPPEALTHPHRLPPRPLVITFDDGYRSVYHGAFPLLKAANAPAIVYVITGAIDEGRPVWVNELNGWLRTHRDTAAPIVARAFGLDPGDDPAALIAGVRQSFDAARVDEVLRQIREACGRESPHVAASAQLFADWDCLGEMRAGGVRIGCHSRTHPSLPRIDDEQLLHEIRDARTALVARLGECDSFAYPFGDLDERARRTAAASGFTTLMQVDGYNVPFRPDAVARTAVRATTPAELFAEIEILAPLKALAARLRRGIRAPYRAR